MISTSQTEDHPTSTEIRAHPILVHFRFEHLPTRLQSTLALYSALAANIVRQPGRPCPERTVALRKLLESRDAALRSSTR